MVFCRIETLDNVFALAGSRHSFRNTKNAFVARVDPVRTTWNLTPLWLFLSAVWLLLILELEMSDFAVAGP